MLNTHFPNFLENLEDSAPPKIKFENEENLSRNNYGGTYGIVCTAKMREEVFKYVQPNKVLAAFKSFGPDKSPGPDGIKPLVLQKLPMKIIEVITGLYRDVLTTSYTPKIWRKMSVVFIPKIGKSDYAEPKSYRPITLSNFILKALERIVQWYLLETAINKPLENQYAYTKGRGTETALDIIINEIEKSVYGKGMTLVVSLDCTGAFDRIKFIAALMAMNNNNVNPLIVAWYDYLLRNREVKADVQGASLTVKPTQGSPEGGVLSPLVWNIIINELLSKFQAFDPVKIIGYADDVLLYVSGKDPSTLANLMNRALDYVQKWGKNNGLVYNPKKTQVVMFERSYRTVHQPPIYMDGKKLSYSETMKYLGVTLQKRYTWSPHVDDKLKACKYLLNKARTVVGREWGLQPDKLMYIYTAILRPRITYASGAWGSVLTYNKNLSNKLNTFQHKIMVMITQGFRSTPGDALNVLLGLPPLPLFVLEQGTIARYRLQMYKKINIDWDGMPSGYIKYKVGHRRIWDDYLNEIPETKNVTDTITPFKNWTTNNIITDPDSVNVYTDGSKINNESGYGWAITRGDCVIAEDSVYQGDATVFWNELTAIMEVLLWLQDNIEYLKTKTVVIYSDSQSAIQAIFAEYIGSKIVAETAKIYQQLSDEIDIGIRWCKGHANLTGNEFADYLAKKGSQLGDPEPKIPATVSYTHLTLPTTSRV